MENRHKGIERREFPRFEFLNPLAYKICSKNTITKMLEGYTTNLSASGLLCNIKDPVHTNDLLWLSFDRGRLSVFEELEKRSFIYQNGIIGKVVRVDHKSDGSFDVGVCFVTREEKNLSNIFPKVKFLGIEP